MSLTLADIAAELVLEIGSGISIPPVVYWLRNSIGLLNNALTVHYTIDPTSLEIVRTNPDDTSQIISIGEDEKVIYKKMYGLYYFDGQIRQNILSYSTNSVVEVSIDNNRVRKIDPSSLSRSLYNIRRLEQEELGKMITAYKINRAKPVQIAGSDTVGCYPYSGERYNRLRCNC